MQYRTKREHTDEQFSFVVLVICQVDLIPIVIKANGLLFKMGEMEEDTLQGVSFIVENHCQLAKSLLWDMNFLFIIGFQKGTAMYTSEINDVVVAAADG